MSEDTTEPIAPAQPPEPPPLQASELAGQHLGQQIEIDPRNAEGRFSGRLVRVMHEADDTYANRTGPIVHILTRVELSNGIDVVVDGRSVVMVS